VERLWGITGVILRAAFTNSRLGKSTCDAVGGATIVEELD
jgi:hypothetical protein